MERIMFKGKIHRATVTEANVDYEGSLTVDEELLEAADILVGEKVQVLNLENGERLETYTFRGGSGVICLNGPAALKGKVGDKIVIISYAHVDENDLKDFKAKTVVVDENNKVIKTI